MRILITGITGFVGGHLVEALLPAGHTLVGVSRQGWPAGLTRLAGRAELHTAELADDEQVEAIVRQARPDWVIHLAGYANTGKSFDEPDRCWADNLDATRSLYDAIARTEVRPRIPHPGSSLGDYDA